MSVENNLKYILTFDVGIKNLAFCLVKYDENNKDNENILNRINIIDWDIIDVSAKHLYCHEIKNKRAICNSVAKYYSLKNITDNHDNPNNLVGYCKKHWKNITQYNKLNKKTNLIKCYKISSNPIYKDNFNTQIERLLTKLELFYQNIICNLYYDINENFTDIVKYKIKDMKIYIENQPVFKNPIMKTISIAIYTFFLMKKIINPDIINSINFISPMDKTKKTFINKISNLLDINLNIEDLHKYDKRKEFAINITDNAINLIKKQLFTIISINKYILSKKKDDYADTLLYVLYILLL